MSSRFGYVVFAMAALFIGSTSPGLAQTTIGGATLHSISNNNTLAATDTTTGNVTTIGRLGYAVDGNIFAGAFSPNGTLYTVTNTYQTTGGSYLATVDLTTGQATPTVAVTLNGSPYYGIDMLQFSPSGMLYASDGGKLYTVDVGSGVLSTIGSFGVGNMMDFAMNLQGVMYAVASNPSDAGNSTFYTINTNTGQATLAATLTQPCIMGLAFDIEGNLWGTDYCSSNSPLFKIDLAGQTFTTGALTGISRPHGGDIYVGAGMTRGMMLYSGSNNNTLVAIDTTTGKGAAIGPFGYGSIFAAAFSPNGTFYTITNTYGTSGGSYLATVNLATGQATPTVAVTLNGSPNYGIDMLQFSHSGTLYASEGGNLYRLDPGNGVLSRIGRFSAGNMMDLAVNSQGVMYGVGSDLSSSTSTVYTIDTSNGQSTAVATLAQPCIMGLAFDAKDNLWGTNYCSNNSPLFKIDLAGQTFTTEATTGLSRPHGGDIYVRIPSITWPTPSTIAYGTALSGTQLNATANVAGAFVYSPAAGTVLPVGVQTLSVTFIPTNNTDYANATARVTITVSPATAVLSLSGLNQTYDGMPKPVTVTTSPANLSGVSVTYNGSATPPTNAGSYPVVATLNNAQYTALNATGTLVIGMATATVTLGNLNQTYDGAPKPMTAVVDPGICGLNVTYNGSQTAPSAIGTYPVVATVNNGNCVGGATGMLVVNAFATSACITTLSPAASKSFNASGGANVQAPQCGIQVNSASTDAFNVSGGNTVVAATAISVAGGSSISGGAVVTPAPQKGAAVPDPLAGVQAPAVGAICDYTNWHNAGAALNPGTYCGGITVSGGFSVTFNPGTYILLGGGLNISGGAAATGTGVSFYNTSDASHAYKPIVVSGGGGGISLAAPRSGPLAGVLFFQDRAIANTSQNTLSGGNTTSFEGALYFPSTPLVYSGGSATTHGLYTIIVANTVTFSGGSSYLGSLGQ